MASIHAEPKPGDLIEIFRSGYSHWALYVGDGYVVHLALPDKYPGAGSCSLFSVLSPRGMVKREHLHCVMGIMGFRVNNHLDHKYSPLPVNKIISSAEEMVGKESEYSLVNCTDHVMLLRRCHNGNCEHFVTNLRYGKARSPKIRAEPKPGDLIEISRIAYSHWALYVGRGYVIHLVASDEFPGAGSSSSLSVLSRKGKVKRELLSDVVGGSRYQINNHLDHQYSPLPVNKIISSAEEMVGKEMEYSVLSRNCEHFVTVLRYGKARSLQAETVLTGAVVTVGAVAVGTVLASSVTENPLPNTSDSPN